LSARDKEVRADRGRDVLPRELARVAAVEQAAVYSQYDRPEAATEIRAARGPGASDYVTLTSSQSARAFARALDPAGRAAVDAGRVRLVTISPVTSAAAREEGRARGVRRQEDSWRW